MFLRVSAFSCFSNLSYKIDFLCEVMFPVFPQKTKSHFLQTTRNYMQKTTFVFHFAPHPSIPPLSKNHVPLYIIFLHFLRNPHLCQKNCSKTKKSWAESTFFSIRPPNSNLFVTSFSFDQMRVSCSKYFSTF